MDLKLHQIILETSGNFVIRLHKKRNSVTLKGSKLFINNHGWKELITLSALCNAHHLLKKLVTVATTNTNLMYIYIYYSYYLTSNKLLQELVSQYVFYQDEGLKNFFLTV